MNDHRPASQVAEHVRLDALEGVAEAVSFVLAHGSDGSHEIRRAPGTGWPEVAVIASSAIRFLPGVSIHGHVRMECADGYATYEIEGMTVAGDLIVRRGEAYP